MYSEIVKKKKNYSSLYRSYLHEFNLEGGKMLNFLHWGMQPLRKLFNRINTINDFLSLIGLLTFVGEWRGEVLYISLLMLRWWNWNVCHTLVCFWKNTRQLDDLYQPVITSLMICQHWRLFSLCLKFHIFMPKLFWDITDHLFVLVSIMQWLGLKHVWWYIPKILLLIIS